MLRLRLGGKHECWSVQELVLVMELGRTDGAVSLVLERAVDCWYVPDMLACTLDISLRTWPRCR
jgi:hypothetical protein